MYRRLGPSFRVALLAAVVAIMVGPGLTASAQGQLFTIDVPTANAVVSNGRLLHVGGWTAGTRVDAYLDGPAGVGEGIGSTMVDKPRPDVQRLTGRLDGGFDFTWSPTILTGGPHTLYLYSLIDGRWTVQTLPIIGEGNVIPITIAPNTP